MTCGAEVAVAAREGIRAFPETVAAVRGICISPRSSPSPPSAAWARHRCGRTRWPSADCFWGKCRNGTAPASRTACAALMCGPGSVPAVQLASTLSMGLVCAARWISTGFGWSTAPAVKRQRPAARVGLGVIADDGEQLGALAQAARLAAGGPRAGVECFQQCGIGDISGLADPAVTVLTGHRRALGPAGRHEDRRGSGRCVVELQRVGLKVATGERGSRSAPQLADHVDRLDQPVVALGVLAERVGGRLFVEPFPRPDPQKYPSRIQDRQRGEGLRHHRRVIPIRGAGHPGAERDAAGGCCPPMRASATGTSNGPRCPATAGCGRWPRHAESRPRSAAWACATSWSVRNCSCESTTPTPLLPAGAGRRAWRGRSRSPAPGGSRRCRARPHRRPSARMLAARPGHRLQSTRPPAGITPLMRRWATR